MSTEQQDRYADLVSVTEAARNVGKHFYFVREFARKRKLIVPIGKREMIPLTELREALANSSKPVHRRVHC